MSTYIQIAKITFPNRQERKEIVLRKIEKVFIESSWKLLTDRATLSIPRKVLQNQFDRFNIREVFRRGDKIIIELGYFKNSAENKGLVTEFEGYITDVSAGYPIVLKCEDEMWKLKQTPVNFSSPAETLDSLLKKILPAYKIDANEGEKLGSVRYSETTVSEVLEKLQQEKNIYSYFKNDTLVSGKVYVDDSETASHPFHLERNAISNNLQYKRAEDLRILIIGRALVNGDKIEARIGEDGGDVYKLNYTSTEVIARVDLERKIQSDYDKKKTDGFDGSFTTFGIPSVFHGEKVELKSSLYADREGQYYVEGITKSFSPNGYKQEIKLGGKVKL